MRRWPYLLVVDDDADSRDGLRTALEMKGYQVDDAGNGKEALDKILDKPPLLVLLDLQMPVMNGRELLQKLRATPETKEIPVVIISGFGFEWEAELMGAQGYVGKPFEPLELEKTMAARVGRRGRGRPARGGEDDRGSAPAPPGVRHSLSGSPQAALLLAERADP